MQKFATCRVFGQTVCEDTDFKASPVAYATMSETIAATGCCQEYLVENLDILN